MYPGMVNSPTTTLSEEFTSGDNHIHVTELAVFPAAPNIAVIGSGTDACTYAYTGKSAASGSGTLTGVSDIEGTDKNWASGEVIARNFTNYDFVTVQDNLEQSPSDMSRQAVTNSNFDIWQRKSTDLATTHRARASNVITITTALPHGLTAGDVVCMYDFGDSGYDNNDEVVASTPSTTTFTAGDTGSDESSTADTTGRVRNISRPVYSAPADGAFTADRWFINSAADSGTFPGLIHTQGTITPEALPGSYYDYKITADGAGASLGDNSYYQLCQYIVGGTARLAGASKKVTVSFWAKSSIANKKIGCYLTQNYGTSGSADEVISGDAWTLTSAWQKCTYTFTLNTLDSKTVSSDNCLILHLALQWGANYDDEVGETGAETFVGSGDIEIAQVQVCAGDVALDYARPDPALEGLRCLYDYQEFGSRGSAEAFFCIGCADSSTESKGAITFAPKRITPSISSAAAKWFYVASGANPAGTDIEFVSITKGGCQVTLDVASGLTTGDAARIKSLVGNTTVAYISVYTGY